MLTHQGKFYGAVSTNQHTNYALQGAYGLTNHLAVAGTFSSLHRKKSDRTEDIDFAEASLGYFTRLPDKRVLEVYVGGGGGGTQRIERNDEQLTTRKLSGSLSKVFSGQIFGLRNNKYLKAANSVFQVGIVINLDKNTTLDE